MLLQGHLAELRDPKSHSWIRGGNRCGIKKTDSSSYSESDGRGREEEDCSAGERGEQAARDDNKRVKEREIGTRRR